MNASVTEIRAVSELVRQLILRDSGEHMHPATERLIEARDALLSAERRTTAENERMRRAVMHYEELARQARLIREESGHL